MEVLRQQPQCIRHAFETRNAAHIDDVRRPFALDDVHAVQVDAERAAAAFGDVTQLRRERERLALLFFFGPTRKHLLDAEQPAADGVDLPVAAVVRVIALGDTGSRPQFTAASSTSFRTTATWWPPAP